MVNFEANLAQSVFGIVFGRDWYKSEFCWLEEKSVLKVVMVNFEANLAWSVFGIFWKRLFGLNPNFVGWRRKAC